jgi:thioredoxin 1
MAENVYEFTDSNFDAEVVKSDKPVLVDFWAEWCGPCKMIGPVVKEIAGDYEGKVKVGKVNVDISNQIAMQYRITSIPNLLIFNNGGVVDSIVGAVPKQEITKRLDAVL